MTRMTSVPQVKKPKHADLIGCCADNVKHLGTLGYCKKHSPFLTPQHMGWSRFLRNWLLITGKIIVVSVMPYIIILAVIIATISLFLWALLIGAEKQELVSCYQHQTYSQTLNSYYLTANEKERCDNLDVVVYAPVK